jgi:ribosomal-protein-alanine N-acetyltransferase
MRPPGPAPITTPRTILETERLLLRPWERGDWPAIHELMSDPRVARYAFIPVTTEEATIALVERVVTDSPKRFPRGFVITLADTEQVIGTCRLALLTEGNGQGDIAYHLLHSHWGHGYATEAARALIAYGFDDFGMHRIGTTVRPENTASWRVLEKIGMRREGHQRLHRWDWVAEEWVDSYLYAIVEDEYRTGQSLLP